MREETESACWQIKSSFLTSSILYLKSKEMMKPTLLLFIALTIIILATAMAYGQPGFPNDHPTQAPIDGGLGILAAAGGAYALKKLRDRRRQGGPEESMD